ncbi:MAG: outer membrane beta-barrel protein [Bacteroidota bacterium]
MDRNFYNDDFEAFLKQKADQYKMYPSDSVWNNIYSSLHGRKRWVALGMVLLFISSALFIGKQVVLSNYSRMATQINKTPEVLLSSKSNKGNIHSNHNVSQYILSTRVRQAMHPLTAPLDQPENSSVHSSLQVKPTNHNNNNNNVVAAEGEPQLIESNTSPLATTRIDDAPAGLSKQSTIPVTPAASEQAKENHTTPAIPQYRGENTSTILIPKPSKWFLQLYASPIVSYRRLSNENQPSIPVSNGYAGNINRYVHHKPAPGLEVGGRMRYRLSNSLSVYAGLQLNYSRYYIDAYKYRIEKASIALNNARSRDTLSGYTNIRNFSGYEPEQLQNQYWQLSVPIGIEIKLLGQKKLQLNVAGGFQPTFLVNSSSYLISSDYKNYIQSPDLARSFNVHTNFEAFVSYQAGGFRWQLGPQFRSQLLSSYSNQYRVREYLTEFGIKFGVTKTLR